MKKILIIFAVFLMALSAKGQKIGDTIISNNSDNLKVKVLYFHITHRCQGCTTIETLVRKTIDDGFKDYLETGYLDLYILNCELPENKDLVKKYDAYGATLAITSYVDGREDKTEDLTTWAFQNVHKPEVFDKELSIKIYEYLK